MNFNDNGTTAELEAISAVEGMQAYDTTLDKLVYYDGSNWAEVSGGGSITIEEQDGSPTISDVVTIKFDNGVLTDDGNGVVSLNFSSLIPEQIVSEILLDDDDPRNQLLDDEGDLIYE